MIAACRTTNRTTPLRLQYGQNATPRLRGSILTLTQSPMRDLQAVLLFIASIVLLAIGGYLTYTDQAMVAASGCMRSGAVLFAVWLALPHLRQFRWTRSSWLLVGVGVCALVLAFRPKAMVIVGPILLLMGAVQFISWLFAPMPGKKSGKRKES